jgi:hypothetical protein
MRNVKAKITLFVFIIASIIIIQLFVWLRPDEISSRYDKERFWVQKTHCSAHYNMVFVGDSRTYHGIVPEKIEHVFSDSINVLNFGYSAAGLNGVLMNMALSKLDYSNNMNVLIIGITPFSLTREAAQNNHIMQEYNRSTFDIADRLYGNKYLKIFEPTTATTLLNKVRGNRNGYYERFESNGWVAAHKIPSDTNEAYFIYKKRFNNTHVDQSIIDSIMFLTHKLNKKNIQVYAYRPPTNKKLKYLEDSLMKFDEKKFIVNFNKVGGKWIEIPDSVAFYAYDGSHLDATSAIKLSEFLGIKLYELSNFNKSSSTTHH